MRVLDNSTASLELSDLGFSQANYDRYSISFTKPYGMILVTGPTGSGKSTTLYATLNIVNRPEVNIITVEDPVEYRLPGINQVQTNERAGLTFASGLKALLRQDPDVILVGEVRDADTARIAVQSALTGHFVLSSLHGNDSVAAVHRLLDMGIEAFLVASAVVAVVSQRLLRRICDNCKEPYQPTEAELVEAAWPMEDLDDGEWPTLYHAAGCSVCGRTGYRGRFGVHEVMILSEEIERLVIERRSTEDIQKVALMQGMLSLRTDGLRKVAMGQTSLEEIFRVVV